MTAIATGLSAGDLTSLAESWLLELSAQSLAKGTLASYDIGIRQYVAHCAGTGVEPDLSKASVVAFTNALLDAGKAPATVILRQQALRLFSAWLAAEGEIDLDPLLGIKPPKLTERVVNSLEDDELRALIKACDGKRFVDRRDTAIVRLMAETGIRAGELLSMTVEDLDLAGRRALVVRGKGGRGRWVYFGPVTASALDRYLRMRRRQPMADTKALWLGDRGLGFGDAALPKMMKVRGRAAGIEHMHPHRLRHTFASRWLAAGGSEGGLMKVAGWRRREMLDRYTQDTASRRAGEEASRLGLGDL